MKHWMPEDSIAEIESTTAARYWDDELSDAQNLAQIRVWLRRASPEAAGDADAARRAETV